MTYKYADFSGITVAYRSHLNGGGTSFGRDFARVVGEHLPGAGDVLEWCSGPGFIGFDLLGSGLCERLWLADINPEAIEAVNATIERNNLGQRARGVVSDGLAGLPTDQRFDLIVGNPPHSARDIKQSGRGTELVYQDIGWQAHVAFYGSVNKHLNPGGSVLIQENAEDSTVDDFASMIKEAGLELIGTLPCTYPDWDMIYYVWCRKV